MDFEDLPAHAAYRADARRWLQAHAPPQGQGRHFADDAALVAAARAWQAKKAAAGYAAITLPTAYGGSGLGPVEQVIYNQEQAKFDTPFGVYEIGLGMCVPTLIALGSEALKARYVRAAIKGREIWCQLFSEPAAGSDLAGLRTRATFDGKRWIINGQKVWTTGAQFADFGLLLARTDPAVPKHAGLTLFIVDMKAPGVMVRPIQQMTGEAEFNEVFFSDVAIDDDHRLTEPGGGWAGARVTLMFERLNVGADIGLIDDRAMLTLLPPTALGYAERISRWYVNSRGLKLLNYRTLTGLAQGVTPGPEQSLTKLVIASQAQEMANAALDSRDEEGVLAGEDLGVDWREVERAWSFAAAMRIAGGTDEILRNIIAERVLGLPAEARVDTRLPFNQTGSS